MNSSILTADVLDFIKEPARRIPPALQRVIEERITKVAVGDSFPADKLVEVMGDKNLAQAYEEHRPQAVALD